MKMNIYNICVTIYYILYNHTAFLNMYIYVDYSTIKFNRIHEKACTCMYIHIIIQISSESKRIAVMIPSVHLHILVSGT